MPVESPSPIPSGVVAGVSAGMSALEALVGKGLDDFCGRFGKVGDGHNHCAHFVSHVLQLKIPGAALCSNVDGSTYAYKDRAQGFCIRVNEVFNSCRNRDVFNPAKPGTGTFLMVATVAANIEKKSPLLIGSMKTKHIGFAANGLVYHFSNKQDVVVKQSFAEFAQHYGGKTILLRADMP